jgi:hypothetical protein
MKLINLSFLFFLGKLLRVRDELDLRATRLFCCGLHLAPLPQKLPNFVLLRISKLPMINECNKDVYKYYLKKKRLPQCSYLL